MALVAAALGLVSCSDKGYWDEYQPEGVEYAIITSNSTVTLTSDKPTAAPVTITFSRGTTVGEQALPVSLTSDSPLVTPTGASTVTFADGSSEASYTVSFTTDFDNVPLFNPEAVVTLTLGDAVMSPASASAWTATITFQNSAMLGEATLQSQLLNFKDNGAAQGSGVVEKGVRVCMPEETTVLVFEAPYAAGCDVAIAMDTDSDKKLVAVNWDETYSLTDNGMQQIFTDPVKGPVYIFWDEAATTVTGKSITMAFMAVVLDASGNPEPYDADSATWNEVYEMPAGWNETK